MNFKFSNYKASFLSSELHYMLRGRHMSLSLSAQVKPQQTSLLAVLSMHRSAHWLSVVVRNGL